MGRTVFPRLGGPGSQAEAEGLEQQADGGSRIPVAFGPWEERYQSEDTGPLGSCVQLDIDYRSESPLVGIGLCSVLALWPLSQLCQLSTWSLLYRDSAQSS